VFLSRCPTPPFASPSPLALPDPCRKVIQRCLQLSLRLSTKLRALPPEHSLQAFCRAATRNFKPSQRRDGRVVDQEGRGSSEVRHHPEAFSTEVGSPYSSPGGGRKWRRGGGDGGGFTPTPIDLRPAVDAGGGGGGAGAGDDLVWRRYAEVVQEVVSTWCRDVDAFDLDPLWLLPKLRAHKNW